MTSTSVSPPGKPARPTWPTIVLLPVLFLGGGAAGVGLSQLLAPQSFVAQFVGLFSFPVAFVAGLHLWLGFAIAIALWRTLTRGPRKADGVEIPGGSIVFVPACVVIIGCAGLLIGIFGSSLGIIATTGLYLLLGLGYGIACWLTARSGYLPFPQE